MTCWDKNTKLEPKALSETLAVRRLHKKTSTSVQVPPQMNRTSSPQRAWEPESKNNLDSQSFSGCLQGAPPKFRGAAPDPLQRYWVNRGGVSSTRGKRRQEEGIQGGGAAIKGADLGWAEGLRKRHSTEGKREGRPLQGTR